jgi:hypothetical protein
MCPFNILPPEDHSMLLVNTNLDLLTFDKPTDQNSDEVKPCDGYTDIKNRTTFPLSNGIISMKTGHSEWNS